MTLITIPNRARHAQIGAPAAVLGILASAFSAAPASATSPVEVHLTSIPHALPASLSERTASTANTPPVTYAVKPGDTVSSIASQFGLMVADVLAWNDLGWRSVIYPGQTLTLVATAAAAPAAPASSTHTVIAGDTLFAIARKHGVSLDALLAANGMSRDSIIYPGQAISISGTAASAAAAPTPSPAPSTPAAEATHTVIAGDTIFALAKKYDTSVDTLLAANGMSLDSIIYPGQKLTVAVAAAAPASTPEPAKSASLNGPQAENAAMIIRIGRELGVSDRGIAIALATSMVESWLRNLDWGDRDSLGLFQQRPSTGWGTAAQIMDRDRSIRVFYGGSSDPNGTNSRGLLDVAGWESMSFSEAAQSVQISAYPERYSQWESQAYEWLALYG